LEVTTNINDYRLAPFHILAMQGQVYRDKAMNGLWRLLVREICGGDNELFIITPYKIVELNNQESFEDAINWWTALTEKGAREW